MKWQQKTGAVNGSGNKNRTELHGPDAKGKMVPSRDLSGGHSESCRGKQKHAEHLSLGQHQVGMKSQLHTILCKGKIGHGCWSLMRKLGTDRRQKNQSEI
jgi:hypothetical protein